MRSHYKNKNMLKNLPFYCEQANNIKKTAKNLLMPNFYLNHHFFLKKLKKTKKLSNYQLSKELPFFPKRPKKLNKHQILKNILPLYET